ncbi:transmembrane and immunoglobulin domain-containing protein 1 isoform X2 [Macrotis lagotis]|uniref:transmembrane and immunoglobulin domain-containing protein 1 isoform X2 n=1 Tax=Macrotis lagotis TaxID=92651 RepID=UPI003D687396
MKMEKDLTLLKMTSRNRLMKSNGSLLLVIMFLPCGLMNLLLTVNNNPHNQVLTVKSGDQLSLKCAVQNYIQGEELLWFREDGRVDLKAENKINSSELCINVNEDDNEVTFTCKLQRNQSMSISVILNVTYGPFLDGRDLQTVQEGSSVNLDCKVKSNPLPQMMWYRNNSVLTLKKNHHQIYQTSELLQLSISKVLKSDNGTYSCRANLPSTSTSENQDFHLIVEDRKITVPNEPIIAASVVVFFTILFGVIARREKIMKLCQRNQKLPMDTSL